MRHLNYNHLLYFWAVLKHGGIARAAEALHVTPQTISGQIKLLEQQLEGPLLEKLGRRLAPTDLGKVAFDYAEEIFSRGQELASVLRGASPRGRRTVTVGVSDAVPKLVTYRVLEPLISGAQAFRVVCHEGPLDSLLADLAAHRLDLVLSSSAVPAGAGVRAFSHLLGESELAFYAAPELAARLRGRFPECLRGAPMLMPTDRSAARRVLDAWFERHGITPSIVAEFDDSALVKTFGQAGTGVFAAPAAIEDEVQNQLGVASIGRTRDVIARFYALSMEKRIKHPAVVAITERARADVFNLAAATRRAGRAPA